MTFLDLTCAGEVEGVVHDLRAVGDVDDLVGVGQLLAQKLPVVGVVVDAEVARLLQVEEDPGVGGGQAAEGGRGGARGQPGGGARLVEVGGVLGGHRQGHPPRGVGAAGGAGEEEEALLRDGGECEGEAPSLSLSLCFSPSLKMTTCGGLPLPSLPPLPPFPSPQPHPFPPLPPLPRPSSLPTCVTVADVPAASLSTLTTG